MNWELTFIKALQAVASPFLDLFFRAVGELGGDIFWLMAIFALFSLGRKKQALSLSALLLTSFYTSYALKYVVGRPRPPLELQRLGPRTDPSMPSTHATEAASNLGYVARESRRRWAYLACSVLAGLAGLSRVYFGLHWPTDVLAGFGLGLLVLASYIGLIEEAAKGLLKGLEGHRAARALLALLTVLVGLLAMFLTPSYWGRPSAYIGGLISGVFLGALLPDQAKPRNPRDLGNLLRTVFSCLIGLLGLAFSYVFLAGLLQFAGSALAGLWASWAGPKVLWAGKRSRA